MKKFRTYLPLFLVLCLVFPLFAACNSAETGGQPDTSAPDSADGTVLTNIFAETPSQLPEEARVYENVLPLYDRESGTITEFLLEWNETVDEDGVISDAYTGWLYTLSEEVVKTGVQVGELFFPGYRQENGAYACLFAFPVKMRTDGYHPQIMAQDKAGNVTSSRLLVRALNRNYRADTLNIPDSFLNFKANELAQLCPEQGTPLEQYLCANNKVRAANDAKLLEVAADPANVTPHFVWEGPFRRLPRSAVKANFGDHRTYVDGSRTKIDEQTHMGLDLASVAQAPIPAAAAGRVIWVDYLGIHGHMVLIDHGLGLMTQYSHLTDYNVKVGDVVKPGDTVGTTGVSGLAGGDHLHFGVLVGGVPVQPLEWLDASWVKNNITSRLKTNVK